MAGEFCIDPEAFNAGDVSKVAVTSSLGECGVKVAPAAAAQVPSFKWSAANKDEHYMLVMVDPDAPSRSKPRMRYWLHWILTNVPGSQLLSGGTLSGNEIIPYAGPTPPKGTGPHRYQVLFFATGSSSLQGVPDLKSGGSRGQFKLQEFLTRNNLGDRLVAGYQFTAENA